MRVMIINIDSVIPNLALEKIKLYHKKLNDEFYYDLPFMRHVVDKIYASCVFTKNKEIADEWAEYGAEVGGPGYSILSKLPNAIESLNPQINLGFITRGCNRDCSFCIVRKKEGKVHQVAALEEIWDKKSRKVILLDNNILFNRKAFIETANYAIKNKIQLDFNQGLDHRLLTEEICHYLKQMPHKYWRFAFDSPEQYESVHKAIDLLNKYSLNYNVWYVLSGYNTSFTEDLRRCNYLKSRNQRVFLMRYETIRAEKKYILLASWTAQRDLFDKWSFDKYCKIKNYNAKEITDGKNET